MRSGLLWVASAHGLWNYYASSSSRTPICWQASQCLDWCAAAVIFISAVVTLSSARFLVVGWASPMLSGCCSPDVPAKSKENGRMFAFHLVFSRGLPCTPFI
jgi:hypothetical protein